MSLVLIRHGSTDLNVEGPGGTSGERTRGWLDVPLSPIGEQEAQQAAQLTKGLPIKAIITSDLQRATKTAQYVSQQHPGVPVISTSALRPWHVGNLTGHLYSEAKPILNDHLQHPDQPIAGGESFYDFAQRSLPLMQTLAESPDTYAAVSHNWNVKLMRGLEASGGEELDHGVVSQTNPVKPGHLLHVAADYTLTHMKPGDDPQPGSVQEFSGPPPKPTLGGSQNPPQPK